MYVLLADDHYETRDMVATLLELSGAHVFMARDGGEALEILQHHVPDVMLLDLGLPVLSGFEVARFARKFRRFDASRIIAFSAHAGPSAIDEAAQCGFDYYLTKPVTAQTIETFIRAPRAQDEKVPGDLKKRSERLLARASRISERRKSVREHTNFLRSNFAL